MAEEVNRFLNSTSKRIRTMRTDRGLNQRELAEMLHIAQSTYSRYENDEMPPGDVVVNLARIFETSTDYILMQTDDPTPRSEYEPLEESVVAVRERRPDYMVDAARMEAARLQDVYVSFSRLKRRLLMRYVEMLQMFDVES